LGNIVQLGSAFGVAQLAARFRERVRSRVRLYGQRPKEATVLSVDEKTGTQALECVDREATYRVSPSTTLELFG